jgi:hypothetical protein
MQMLRDEIGVAVNQIACCLSARVPMAVTHADARFWIFTFAAGGSTSPLSILSPRGRNARRN